MCTAFYFTSWTRQFPNKHSSQYFFRPGIRNRTLPGLGGSGVYSCSCFQRAEILVGTVGSLSSSKLAQSGLNIESFVISPFPPSSSMRHRHDFGVRRPKEAFLWLWSKRIIVWARLTWLLVSALTSVRLLLKPSVWPAEKIDLVQLIKGPWNMSGQWSNGSRQHEVPHDRPEKGMGAVRVLSED